MIDRASITRTEIRVEDGLKHPGDLLNDLIARIQLEGITKFQDVQDEWLGLMWAIDQYRKKGQPPVGMGNQEIEPGPRLQAIYRTKGNWFATVLSLLLQNRTSQPINPRTKVEGFSQFHQIDIAWPARLEDVLVCVETKVTGAPAYGTTGARSAMADFANRRKELKFAATDLKLFRRQQETRINHWGVWKDKAPPKTYFLWAARLKTTGRGLDDISKLASEVQNLVSTYLEGAGLFAWREVDGSDGYGAEPLPRWARFHTIDDVLLRIESEIKDQAPEGTPPPPVTPKAKAVNVREVADDEKQED
jgi:hypothetical protein